MQTTGRTSLLRKQYLVTPANVSKLEALAKANGTSATDIVRKAIDAYDPDGLDEIGETELMSLVSERLKEAIKDTQATRRRLNKTLKAFERS